MDLDTFKDSLDDQVPPEELSPALEALWHDGKGHWDRAHEVAQSQDDETGAWVHAYLHRKEGDTANAGYWYRRAGKPMPEGTLDQEWENMVRELL